MAVGSGVEVGAIVGVGGGGVAVATAANVVLGVLVGVGVARSLPPQLLSSSGSIARPSKIKIRKSHRLVTGRDRGMVDYLRNRVSVISDQVSGSSRSPIPET
ncbi:MAG: hypothetical protein H8D78_21665 [Chloroflexi bacterium]|nr:hypothetical protein [Chloroflexota bacterium]